MLKQPRIYEVVRFKQRFLKNEEEILPPMGGISSFCAKCPDFIKGIEFVSVAEKLNIDESKE